MTGPRRVVFDPSNADHLEHLLHESLGRGDMQGVEASIRALLVVDTRRALRIVDDLKFALRVAEMVHGRSEQ